MKWAMKSYGLYIILIVMMIFISSCDPCKRLAKKCPPQIKDSISYVEKIKFDTITLVSPSDTLWISVPVEADLNDLLISTGNKPGPSVKIKIKDKVLTAEVVCPEDSLKTVISSLQTELSNQTTVTVEKEVPVNHIPKIAWIAIIFSCCVIVYLATRVYLRIKSGGVKSLLNALK